MGDITIMAYILAIVCSALILIADQVSKFFIVENFQLGESETIIDGLLNFTYIHNRGAAFGILQNQTWIFLGITVLVMVICIGMLVKKTYDSKLMFWAILVILAGGTGNMLDRIFRGGNVVDFLEFDFIKFPIFNIADCSVVIGASLIILYFMIDFIGDVKGKKSSEIDSIDLEESEGNE